MSETKEWLLILRQGGGCDYTIGCGMTTMTVYGDTEEEAMEDARFRLDEAGYMSLSRYGTQLDSAEIIELPPGGTKKLPYSQWLQEKKEEQEREAKEQEQRSKRAQYEALKKEFG